VDYPLGELRQFIEFLETASVQESAKFRLQHVLEYWKDVERRWIKSHYAVAPEWQEQARYVIESVELALGERLGARQQADYDWVKSQLQEGNQARPAEPPRRGRIAEEDREQSKRAIQKVLNEHREQVMNRTLPLKAVAKELILRKAFCWHRGGWEDKTAINLISSEMKELRQKGQFQ
jgi:hypothetical protein